MKIDININKKGYQFLQNDFFELCEKRKIHRLPMLLYIYLRGLYSRFQRPDFFWRDSELCKNLGFSRQTLSRARLYLQERGLLTFKSGIGRTATHYQMLGTVLLPELRVSKMDTLSNQSKGRKSVQNGHSLDRLNNRSNNRIEEVFKGITKEERKALKTSGIL